LAAQAGSRLVAALNGTDARVIAQALLLPCATRRSASPKPHLFGPIPVGSSG
jgi:hypothetical protein